MPRRATKWDLSSAAMERLLTSLDRDPAAAGEKYEHLRRALLRYFAWRGEADPETCADESLDRVARRLESGPPIEDVPSFAHGVARLVRLERIRAAAAHPSVPEAAIADRLAAPVPAADVLSGCLERCLDRLTTEDRTIILRYYTGARREKIDGRGALARDLGLTPNALRHRAQRIRDRLKACAKRCAGHETGDLDSTD